MKNKKLISILLSCLYIVLAFLGGYFSSNVQVYSRLMELDYKQKQSDAFFTHINLDVLNFEKEKKVDKLLSYQYKSLNNLKKYIGYVTSYNNNELTQYKVSDFKMNDISIEIGGWESSPIATVLTYSDTQTMEMLPLYLHQDLGFNMAGHNGAKTGSYIPASLADVIISQVNDVSNYDELIQRSPIFKIANENGVDITLSINNIYYDYLDENNSDMVKHYSYYHNYQDQFSSHCPNAIITSNNILMRDDNCIAYFDLSKNYGNIRDFIGSISLKEFKEDGISLSCSIKNESVDLHGLETVIKKKNETIVFCVIFCITALAIGGLNFYLFTKVNEQNIKKTILRYLWQIMPLLVLLVIEQFCFLIFPKRYVVLLIFNYIGNAFILLPLLAYSIYLIVVYLRQRKEYKNEK